MSETLSTSFKILLFNRITPTLQGSEVLLRYYYSRYPPYSTTSKVNSIFLLQIKNLPAIEILAKTFLKIPQHVHSYRQIFWQFCVVRSDIYQCNVQAIRLTFDFMNMRVIAWLKRFIQLCMFVLCLITYRMSDVYMCSCFVAF